MDILLVAGLWLKRDVWAETADALRRLGHEPVAVALPGVDGGSMEATLEDQVEAVLAEVDAADRPLLVGHSAACALGWIVADRRPKAVSSLALIGGFPLGDGQTYADFFPVVDGAMPFPGWGPFEGPDAADLDERARGRIASEAVPVPGGVAQGTVSLRDEGRFDVPVVMVCPEFTPEQARAWVDAGEVPELARAKHVMYVDIPTGHWPMVTQPAALAGVLDTAARKG
jgi:pimeloyl-ACP methyl ester carboxylesterase